MSSPPASESRGAILAGSKQGGYPNDQHDTTDAAGCPGKKPLDPHLFSGPDGSADDVRVQSGYPIWNLIATWMVAGYNDAVVIDGYTLSLEEWEAAKHYYLDHKIIIDARIIGNTQPGADDDVPVMNTSEEYFAWLARQDDRPAVMPAQTPQDGRASD